MLHAADLDELLHRLERDYASVHAGRVRLHDDLAAFSRGYLRADLRRTDEKVKAPPSQTMTLFRCPPST
jgi:hypothetical protein